MGAADILSLAESAGVTVDDVGGWLRCLGPVSP